MSNLLSSDLFKYSRSNQRFGSGVYNSQKKQENKDGKLNNSLDNEENQFLKQNSLNNELNKKDALEQKSQKEKEDSTNSQGLDLTEEELSEIEHLKERDQEVRTHENAHQRAGGAYAGFPQYSYTKGPDGKDYITDGSVSISVSEESTPQKTIEKMEQVQRAALAPAEPSGQDLKVASQAANIENEARRELASNNTENKKSSSENKIATNEDSESTEKNTPKEAQSEKSLSFENIIKSIQKHYRSSYTPSRAGSSINTFG